MAMLADPTEADLSGKETVGQSLQVDTGAGEEAVGVPELEQVSLQ